MKKSDWETTFRELLAERRLRLGELPGADELMAWFHYELPMKDRERIEEFLVYYPRVAQALVEPFPAPGDIQADIPEALSEAELDEDWERLQDRSSREEH